MTIRLKKQSPPAYHWLFFLGVGIALVISYFEIQNVFNAPQNWEKLFAPSGILTVALYLLVLLVGLFYLLIYNTHGRAPFAPIVRWGLVVSLLVATSWIFLFSPWQTVLARPWSELLFSAGAAKIIQILVFPEARRGFGWS